MPELLAVQSPAERSWAVRWLGTVNHRFAGAPAEELLLWSLESFAPNVCLATSFGPQSIVLMHMLSRLRPKAPIFYLDTDLLFDETYALQSELSTRLGLEFVRVAPSLTVEQQSTQYGHELWSNDPDRCCHLRKVLPLRKYLASKEAWITGIRRCGSRYRRQSALVEWDTQNGLVKLNPLLDWSDEQVWVYLKRHDLPTNPLHEQGYPSIGCRPCTRPVRPGEDPRAGRWPGTGKTECGIHGSEATTP